MSQLTITQADAGKSFTVNLRDAIAIFLPESPTTGYLWAIDANNAQIMMPSGDDFAIADDAATGGGGMRNFRFSAHSLGTVHLRLKYWREWLGDSSIIKRFDVTIVVQD
jgi:inhibitor of cysteine peptidase